MGLFSGIGNFVKDSFALGDDLGRFDFGGAGDRAESMGDSIKNAGEGLGDWATDMYQYASNESGNWRDKFKNNPLQLAVGAGDPFSTRVWNGVLGKEWTPYVNQYGGASEENILDAQSKGIDTGAIQGVDGIGRTIGKGIINNFTFGLGGTALDAMENYGNKRKLDVDWGSAALSAASSAYGAGYFGDMGGAANFNLGSSLGVDNALAQGAINNTAMGAAKGGGSALLRGGDVSDGAEKGAVGGLVNYGINQGESALGDYFKDYQGQNTPGNYTVGMNGGQGTGSVGGDYQMQVPQQEYGGQFGGTKQAPSYGSFGDPGATSRIQSAGPQSQASSPVQNYIAAMTGGGKPGDNQGYLGMASNLMGMYQAYDQRRSMKDQYNQLNNLFTPNSAYAQQMRQAVERKDAAGGRRSQYGPREAQLAAAMAQTQAKMSPQLMELQNGIDANQRRMMNNGLMGAARTYQNMPQMKEDFGSLMDMFKGGR